MALCEGTTLSGAPCQMPALTADESWDVRHCFQHSQDEAVAARRHLAKRNGGLTSKKIDLVIRPEDLSLEFSTLPDVKKARVSIYQMTLLGVISPAQAMALDRLLAGIRESMIDVEIEKLGEYKDKLIVLLGNEREADTWPE